MTDQNERDNRDFERGRLDRSENVDVQRRLTRVEHQVDTTLVEVKEIKADVKLLLIKHYQSAGSAAVVMGGLTFFRTLPGIVVSVLSALVHCHRIGEVIVHAIRLDHDHARSSG